MKVTILLFVPIVVACVATGTGSSRAAEDPIYRSRDFARSAAEITDCPGHVLIKRHPELSYVSGPTIPGVFIAGAWSPSTHDYTWLIIAKSTSSNSSHIDLYIKNIKTAEIEEVWQVIEECAKR